MLTKHESEIKYLPQPVEVVYERLADLSHLAALRDNLDNPAFQAMLEKEGQADKLEQIRSTLATAVFEPDGVCIGTKMGQMSLVVVERDAPKLIKLASKGAPIDAYLWLQLLPAADGGTRLRVTAGAEVNFFMKAIVAKPLQQVADGIAGALAGIPATVPNP